LSEASAIQSRQQLTDSVFSITKNQSVRFLILLSKYGLYSSVWISETNTGSNKIEAPVDGLYNQPSFSLALDSGNRFYLWEVAFIFGKSLLSLRGGPSMERAGCARK